MAGKVNLDGQRREATGAPATVGQGRLAGGNPVVRQLPLPQKHLREGHRAINRRCLRCWV